MLLTLTEKFLLQMNAFRPNCDYSVGVGEKSRNTALQGAQKIIEIAYSFGRNNGIGKVWMVNKERGE